MRLTVETGPLAGTVVSLDRDQPTILGSGESCDLRVQEAGVLERHAVVKALRSEGFGLKALGPGVRVNGAQIEATPLADGDVIQLGTTRIAFGELQQKGLPTIAGYRIQEELGRGGMGVVYRAEQTSLHRPVALKVLSHDLTENARFVSNFVAEAQAAAKLQHPNVVAVFDVDHDGDTYYYTMELMQNGSCEDWIKQNGPMPVDRALQVIAEAAEGLAYAESLGIVHRDIKPDNLMLDQHGVCKIADLGLAGAEAEGEQRAVGTPHFMAPEQVLRRPIDHRTDLYALGCTFYRLVTGRTPFRGHTVKDILRAQVKDDAEPAHRVNNQVPADVAAMIQRLMQKEPASRYQTANALLEDVAIRLQPPHKKGLWVGLATAGVLIAGGAIYWAVNKPTEYIEVERKYDDPEKQRFADENRELRLQAREDKATIALLQARVSGLADEALAQALDAVAAAHPDTAAAVEAGERAAAVRGELRQREQRRTERRRAIDDYLAVLTRSMTPQLEAHDYALAMRTLQTPPDDAGLAGDPDLEAGLERLRRQVVDGARARLSALRQAIDGAAAARDPEALGAAVDALSDDLAARGRWPAGLDAELQAAQTAVGSGRDTLAALQREVRDNLWQQYRAMFLADDGVARRIERFDFAGAAGLAERFAQAAPETEAGTWAAGFGLAARAAETFAAALERAIAAGEVQHTGEDGITLQVVRWERAQMRLAVVDASKRTAKEQFLATDSLLPDDWAGFCAVVTNPEPGLRECFLAFVLLARHARAATAYLAGFDPADDQSGTDARGYPLASDWFDVLARRLPDDPARPWVRVIRAEVEAGQRLAAGLRALSERRNLAAAGHLDKLIAEHAHSYLVMVLP